MKIIKIVLAMLVSVFFLNGFAQETVYLQSFKYGDEMEHGRGIIKTRPGECFVIAPKHVAKDSIVITGENQIRSSGQVEKSYRNIDLAIVRIDGGGQQSCRNWSAPDNFATIINDIGTSFLEVRDKNGGIENIPVIIKKRDGKSIMIVPKNKDEGYIKGMSGAALFGLYKSKKIFLGLFLSVDAKSNTGLVLRADEIERATGDFFDLTPDFEFTEPVDTNGYRLELTQCQKIENTVKCNFKIMSTENDKEVRMNVSGTKIYDINNKEYIASVVTLANKSDTRYVTHRLIKGTPADCEIQFKYVATESEGLAKILLSLFDNEYGNFTIDFNNVPFTLAEDPNANKIQELKGIKFEIIECKTNVKKVFGIPVIGSISCKFNLESLNTNQEVMVATQQIILINEKGKAKTASKIKLGDLVSENYVQYPLIQNVPLEGVIEFKKPKIKNNEIKFLRIKLKSTTSGEIDFEFTNIPLDKGSILNPDNINLPDRLPFKK